MLSHAGRSFFLVIFFIFVFPQNREAAGLKARLAADPGVPAAEKTKDIVALRDALAKAAATLASGPPGWH